MKQVCLKYRHILSNSIAPKSADLKAFFEMEVNRFRWGKPENHGPVRPQSTIKEAEIKRALEETLA